MPSSLYNLATSYEQKYVFFDYSSSDLFNEDLNVNNFFISSENYLPIVFAVNPSIMLISCCVKAISNGLQQILC